MFTSSYSSERRYKLVWSVLGILEISKTFSSWNGLKLENEFDPKLNLDFLHKIIVGSCRNFDNCD